MAISTKEEEANANDADYKPENADGKDEEQQMEKLPYPKSVFFIVSNEFCERFSYYGMRTILSLYLVDMLRYEQSDATVIYHTFTMLVYFFPLFGAIISDSWLGKFRTILYVSCIYATGNIVLSLAATPPLNLPDRGISILGLLLIAIGTGGIKPCVSAFGGDQFILPQQAQQLAKFFSLFYFSINSGSLISTFITPILREDVKCFGNNSCYSLAFAIPGILMVVSIIIFACGKPLYRIKKPAGNMLVQVSKCIGNAISTKFKSKGEKKDHWLDYAEENYGKNQVNDIKALLRVLLLFIPLPVFWALFDQQGSGWTFMARRMDGDLGFFTILPDQMQVINPLLILIFIPLFQYAIYPVLNKCRLLTTPLQRLTAGGCLAAVSFVVSACISLALENTFPRLPERGEGQLRIYNGLECDITITAKGLSPNPIKIPSLDVYTNVDIAVNNIERFPYSLSSECSTVNGRFDVYEKKSNGYFFNLTNIEAQPFKDSVEKNDNGNPFVRVLVSTNQFVPVTIENSKGVTVVTTNSTVNELYDFKPDDCKVYFGNHDFIEHTFSLGGVYTVIANRNPSGRFTSRVLEITEPNSIHILLLIPQYIIITMGEIMFSITGLEFAYSQAPSSMKSVLTACWLLTTAFGNLIVVIIESVEPFEEQSKSFFLYAGLMLLDMVVFALMATQYTYVKRDEDEDSDTVALPPMKQNGVENAAFKSNEDT